MQSIGQAWGSWECWVGAGLSAVTSVLITKGTPWGVGGSVLSATSKPEIVQKRQVLTKSLQLQCGGATGSGAGGSAACVCVDACVCCVECVGVSRA